MNSTGFLLLLVALIIGGACALTGIGWLVKYFYKKHKKGDEPLPAADANPFAEFDVPDANVADANAEDAYVGDANVDDNAGYLDYPIRRKNYGVRTRIDRRPAHRQYDDLASSQNSDIEEQRHGRDLDTGTPPPLGKDRKYQFAQHRKLALTELDDDMKILRKRLKGIRKEYGGNQESRDDFSQENDLSTSQHWPSPTRRLQEDLIRRRKK